LDISKINKQECGLAREVCNLTFALTAVLGSILILHNFHVSQKGRHGNAVIVIETLNLNLTDTRKTNESLYTNLPLSLHGSYLFIEQCSKG